MKASRASVLAGAGTAYASICIPRYPAGAAEFTYKIGNVVGVTDPLTVYPLKAAARLKRDTNGRFELQVYPNSQLGGAPAMMEQVRVGALEFALLGDTNISEVVPAVGLDTLPFLFGSHEDAWRALDGTLGKYIRSTYEKAGLYPVSGLWDSGFHQVFNNVRPVRLPEDLKGLKLRIVASQILVALFKGLGASPTPMEFKDFYTACQTHLIDGGAVGYGSFATAKLYEVVKYVSETNHIWSNCTIIGNPAVLQRLPKSLRDTVEHRLEEASREERGSAKTDEANFRAQLIQQGMIYNKTDLAPFSSALQKTGVYAQWRSSFGSAGWSALEQSVGPVA